MSLAFYRAKSASEGTLDENLQQVKKPHTLSMAIRLETPWSGMWETLLKELGVSQSVLLKECIKLRMAVYFAQRDGLGCKVEQQKGGQEVDLAEFLELRKPQDGKF
jgi:hypothetical protein